MEVSCCFQKLVGDVCASDKRYEGAVVVPLSSCQKDILGHTRSVGVIDINSEVGLILARASIFSPPRNRRAFCMRMRQFGLLRCHRGILCELFTYSTSICRLFSGAE